MNPPNKARALVYLTLLFGVGFGTGYFTGQSVNRPPMRPPRPRNMAEEIVRHMKADLDLTPDQVRQIEPLARDAAQAGAEAHRNHMAAMEAVFSKSRERMAAVLTPAQRVRMEALDRKKKEEFDRMRAGQDGGGPGPHAAPPPPNGPGR